MMKKVLTLLVVISMMLNMIAPAFADEDYHVSIDMQRTFYDKQGEGRVEINDFVLDLKHENNNKVYVEYTMNFASIPKSQFPVEQPKKEVVLVVDTSGSMNRDLTNNSNNWVGDDDPSSRMHIAKESAKLFLNKLAVNDKMNFSVISYNTVANIHHTSNPISNSAMKNVSKSVRENANGTFTKLNNNKSNYEDIYDSIDGLQAGGSTNIGDALRLSYRLIENTDSDVNTEKFLVFLTDGKPERYTYVSGRPNTIDYPDKFKYIEDDNYYYYNGSNEISSNSTSGNSYTIRGRDYANYMAEELGGFKKTYFLTFGPLDSSVLPGVSENSGALDSIHWPATTAADIQTAYEDIALEIGADLSLKNAVYKETLPQGMTFSLPTTDPLYSKYTVDGQDVTFNPGPISFTLVGSEYVAQPITFGFYLTFNEADNYEFLSSKNEFNYRDVEDGLGETTTKHFPDKTFNVELDPIDNFTASRPQETGENPKNEVLLEWDAYDGAVDYNIYKVYNGEEKLVKTVASENTSSIIPIEGQDGAETTYKVEAVLSNGKKSGKAQATVDTAPSIMNVRVERENNTFIVSWDMIDDEVNPGVVGEEDKTAAIYYNMLPIIEGPSLEPADIPSLISESASNDDIFKVINNRVYYEFTLPNPEKYISYDDTIKFKIDAEKIDYATSSVIDVKESTSIKKQIKQVVITQFVSSMDDFEYAKKKEVVIDFKSDENGFPEGVHLYDPVLVVELKLPAEVTDTPLEFTYPTVKVNRETKDTDGNPTGYETLSVTSKTVGDQNIAIYIQLNDYSSTVMQEDTALRLHLDYAVAYKSIKGILDSNVLNALKDHDDDLKEYQIPAKFRQLLDAEYTTSIDELLEVEAYFAYNTSAKVVENPNLRDVKVGVSTSYIKFKNISGINDEF